MHVATELTLHHIEGTDILQHSVYSRSSVYYKGILTAPYERSWFPQSVCAFSYTLMYDRPWLSMRNRHSTYFVYNCESALSWRNLNRSITQELILNNHLSIFVSLFALLRQSLNYCRNCQDIPQSFIYIYVSPLASLRWTRTAPYYRNCYSTTIFNVSSQLKC